MTDLELLEHLLATAKNRKSLDDLAWYYVERIIEEHFEDD